MENADVIMFYDAMEHRLSRVKSDFHRYLFSQIDWRDNLIAIKGARGTGKTTILLQRYIEAFRKNHTEQALYVSADDLWFTTHSLKEMAYFLYTRGISHLFVDEIHHLPNWQILLKNITDEFPDLYIVYSGSSILKLDRGKADLSRRQAMYTLNGLSFREFLAFEGILETTPFRLDDILKNHREIARGITSRVKVLPLFEKYMKRGYYPFYKSVHALYESRLLEIVNQVLESDYPAVEDVTPLTVRKTKKMLMVLAASCPQIPQMNKLYAELETNRAQGLKMLKILERAQLLALLSSEKATLKNLSRPDKIYPDNPNLMNALVHDADIGTQREAFFLNQLRGSGHEVVYPPQGDFMVDGKFLFEVGGPGKGFRQIKDQPDSFVVNDGEESGFGNKIPLWLFGFLY